MSVDEFKAKGNQHYTAGHFQDAVKWYTKAIGVDAKNHVLYSNRSAAYLGVQDYTNALRDAEKAVELNPNWNKGYYRKAMTLENLWLYKDGIDVCNQGLKKVPNDADLKRKKGELEVKMKEYNKIRLSGPDGRYMPPDLEAKEMGNAKSKDSAFPEAVEHYTRGIHLAKDPELKATCFNNRAYCYHQLRNFEGEMNDTTECLKLQPNNVKAMMRRALAYEALDKWSAALADWTKVRELDPNAKQALEGYSRVRKTMDQYGIKH